MSSNHLYPFYIHWHAIYELRLVHNYSAYGGSGYIFRIPIWFWFSLVIPNLNFVTDEMPEPKNRSWEWREIRF